MEVPVLPEKEKQKIFREMWMGAMMGYIGFIVEKLGIEAIEELNSLGAKKCALDLRSKGINDPLKFAMNYAVVNKNVFGSDVVVEGDENKAKLITIKCANLDTAMEFKEKGMPITREQHCDGCINGYFKKVAENLGLKLEAEFTENGCEITIEKF